MRWIAMAFVAALAALTSFVGADAAQRYAKQKVVYHINQAGGEGAKGYLTAMGNVSNHIAAVGADNIEVKVVMHGDGVGLLKVAKDDLRLQSRIAGLRNQKVGFLVCNNTLTQRKIDPDKDLFEVYPDDIVPSGVAELSSLQQQGYTYVKP